MEQAIIESEAVESQEVTEVTAPATVNEDESTDVWAEDFNTEDVPAETIDEPVVEPKETTDKLPDYITQGLGDLDEPIVVKVNGKIYDIKDKDQIRDLMERGFNATQKLQELADLRRELEQTKNPDITEQELSNLDTSAKVEQIAEKIASSSYVEDFRSFIDILPGTVTDQLRGDPQMLEGLRQDVESGLANKILPTLQRYMDVDNLTFKEAYMKSGSEVMKSQQSRSQAIDKLTAAPRTGSVPEVQSKSIWSMSDSEYKSLMDSERT